MECEVVNMAGASPATTIDDPESSLRGIVVAGLAPAMLAPEPEYVYNKDEHTRDIAEPESGGIARYI